MSGNREAKSTHQTKLEKYAMSKTADTDGAAKAELKIVPRQETEVPSLKDIMDAITGMCTALENTMDSTEVKLIRANLQKMSEKVKTMETVTTDLCQDSKTMQQQIKDLQAVSKAMESKLDDYEGRSRQNNLRILGVPERAEGPTPDLFVEGLITNHLQPKNVSNFFSVERAQHVPGGRPKPGAAPRPLLARLFNYRDRDMVLQTTRTAPPIKIYNSVLTFSLTSLLMYRNRDALFRELKVGS